MRKKSPTDKTSLGYVAPPSDIPSTSMTIFVKPAVQSLPPLLRIKGRTKLMEMFRVLRSPLPSKNSHMPSLRTKWACSTPMLPPQSSESKGQERSAQTGKLWYKTSGPTSDSMASGSLPGSMESSSKASGSLSSRMASRPKASCPKAPGSSASAALAEICSCQT